MKVAIVLGGTVPHCELVLQLKHRGYYVVLVDYTSSPPAKKYADEHIMESTLDKEKVLEIAQDRKASLVISTCVDQANVTCCYVAEKLGLPHPYSYQAALNVTDKSRMKKKMWENAIPTSKYVYVRGMDELVEGELKYPLMVKPADSNSANGVKKAENREELDRYFREAQNFSRNGLVVVEEFMEGPEISAYCMITDHKAKLIMVQERISVIEGEEQAIKCYASIAPARISENAKKLAEEIATKIAGAFELDNTPLFFQGIVCGDDINVIEFAPRVGGGISSQTIKAATDYDIVSAAIDSFLGNPIETASWHPMDRVYIVNQIYGKNGIFERMCGEEELLQEGIVDKISLYVSKGAQIDASRASSSRIGVMVVSAGDEKGALEKIKKAFECLDVFDINGKSIMRSDMNLNDLCSDIDGGHN